MQADLQSVRLAQKPTRSTRPVGGVEDKALREKWKVVHGRKERLSYTAERLALEIEQKVTPFMIELTKERQLRMSLNRASLA